MKTMKIRIEGICTGDIIAEDIMNKYGALIVAANTTLNDYIKAKLAGYSIRQVKIYRRLERGLEREKSDYHFFLKNYENNIHVMKRIVTSLYDGNGIDIDLVNLISENISNNINSSTSTIWYLNQLRQLDEYTYTHSINVGIYSALIGRWMGLAQSEAQDVLKAGILHDIGKIRIPIDILNKKTALAPDEFEEIKKHSVYGYRILEEDDGLSDAVKSAVLMHHERADKSGYPLGLDAACVHLYAKIIAVADVYDAMTSDRVYRKKATPFDVFEMFQTTGVRSFDTKVLWTFLNNISVFYNGSKVVLNNGCIGEIVYIPPHCIIKPVVKLNHEYVDLSENDGLKIISVFTL